jgi:hypothetical protein
MRLSNQARDRLSELFDRTVFCWKGGHTKEDVLAEIRDILATSDSFSDLVIEANQVSKKCGTCGKTSVVYRLTFRVVLIPALRVLVEANRPLTTRELVDALPPHVGRMVSDYAAELRHWGLITQPKIGVYQATDQARAFLAGELPIAAWTWPRTEQLPEECVDGPLKYVDELTDDHAKGDKARHVEEAVPEQSL